MKSLSKENKLRILYALIILVGILVDQLSKAIAVATLKGEASFPLWQGVLHLTYVENRGAAFGMLKDHRWVFLVISTVSIAAILIYMFKARPAGVLERISLAMIAGGGIGNMIDRVVRGFVVDFIDVRCINFYVFNIADSFVCVGCGLLILTLIRSEIREAQEKKHAQN